jgi:transcriptional regulator with XRE-family HTH domain
MAVGSRVAEERQIQGITQQELASRVTKLGYKISQTGIDKIEKRNTQRPKCLKELAIALKVTEGWLLTGQQPKHPTPTKQSEQLLKEVKLLSPEDQETVLAQFRALLDVALRKERKKIN